MLLPVWNLKCMCLMLQEVKMKIQAQNLIMMKINLQEVLTKYMNFLKPMVSGIAHLKLVDYIANYKKNIQNG